MSTATNNAANSEPLSTKVPASLARQIIKMAQHEHRYVAQMVRLLLQEAVEARVKKEKQ